jgi:hypothetical protein
MPDITQVGWEKWKKVDPRSLACYINPESIAEQFQIAPGTGVPLQRVGGTSPVELAAGLYRHLKAFDLGYDRTPIDFTGHHDGEQLVRDASQLRRSGGSCLDLSLLYAGLCERFELRPIVVVLRDHALVAVALETGFEDVRRHQGLCPGEEDLLRQGLMHPDGAKARLLDRVDRGSYILVECTGLSRTGRLAGPAHQLDFAEATAEGVRQLRLGDLRYLVDPTFFHLQGIYRAFPLPQTPTVEPPVDVTLGTRGVERLTGMLATIGVAPPGTWSVTALERLAVLLAGDTAGDSHARALITRVIEDMVMALRTATFVQHTMPQAVRTGVLRLALCASGYTADPSVASLRTVADYFDHLVLANGDDHRGLPHRLAIFVVHLAVEAGMDLDAPAMVTWAQALGVSVDVNDLIRKVRERRNNDRARLIISLHGSVSGGWPLEVVAWWLLDDVPSEPQIIKGTATQADVERAIRAHVEWADDLTADVTLNLRRVEIAVPTELLLTWRPEETDVSGRLVRDYDVVIRWSDRLKLKNVRSAHKRLRALADCDLHASVDWLDRHDTTDIRAIADQLRDGVLARAIGLRFHPERQEVLLRTLLDHSPIVLWPEAGAEVSASVLADLSLCWPTMPQALAEAYRKRLGRSGVRPVATVRAVWDDESWLRFCRQHAGPGSA